MYLTILTDPLTVNIIQAENGGVKRMSHSTALSGEFQREGKGSPKEYDSVYGIPSSGLHSNGYSLVNTVFGLEGKREEIKQKLSTYYEELGCTLQEELLRPTRIYVKTVQDLRARYRVHALVHITGGGFVDNPPRVMPDGFAMQINLDSWGIPQIFYLIKKLGKVRGNEMLRTFNLGIGMLVVSPDCIEGEGIVKVGKVVDCKRANHSSSATLFTGGQKFMTYPWGADWNHLWEA